MRKLYHLAASAAFGVGIINYRVERWVGLACCAAAFAAFIWAAALEEKL